MTAPYTDMARAATLGLCALFVFCLLSAAAATSYKDCAVSCVPSGPHETKPHPNAACVKMCKVSRSTLPFAPDHGMGMVPCPMGCKR